VIDDLMFFQTDINAKIYITIKNRFKCAFTLQSPDIICEIVVTKTFKFIDKHISYGFAEKNHGGEPIPILYYLQEGIFKFFNELIYSETTLGFSAREL
jgi:hypothetical protein